MKRIKQMKALQNFSFYVIQDLNLRVVARIHVYFGPSCVQIDVDDVTHGFSQVKSSTLSVAWGKVEIQEVKLYDGSCTGQATERMQKRLNRGVKVSADELRMRGLELAGDGSGRVYFIAGLDRLTAKGYTVVAV